MFMTKANGSREGLTTDGRYKSMSSFMHESAGNPDGNVADLTKRQEKKKKYAEKNNVSKQAYE